MKISTSTLGMDATTTHRDVQMSQGKLTVAAGSGIYDQFQLQLPGISTGFGRQAVCAEIRSCDATSTVSDDKGTVKHEQDEKYMVGRVVSEILNQQVQVREFSAVDRGEQRFSAGMESKPTGPPRADLQRAARMALSLQQVHYQEETLRVNTTGTIETVDGRTVSLELGLTLERMEYTEQTNFTSMLGARFIDPLILSFEDGLSVIGNSQFSFDLNRDGTLERIGSLTSGSGFLVLDKNGDGLVNDGGELFGPDSGSGYNELRVYDTDANNWIDENDTVFDRLQLWMGGGSEEGRLVGLREAGVGALSLSSVGVGFQLKATDGRILGQVGSAGIFLTEAGEVRPLAEIDLAVDQETPSLSWPQFSGEMQEALRMLREMMIATRRRVMELGILAGKEKRAQHRVRLLEQLFAFKVDDRSRFG